MTKIMKMGWVGAAFCALALSGCGKAKMDTQTALQTFQSLSAARANPAEKSGSTHGAQLAESTTPGSTGGSSGSTSPGEINYMGKHCQVSQPSSGSFGGFGKSEMSIGGSECPVEWKIETDQSNPMDVKMSLHFAAKTGDAKMANDIDSLDLTAEMTQSSDGKSGDLHMKMTGHSQSKGDVTLDLNGHGSSTDGRNSHAEFNGTLTAGDKAADIKVVVEKKNGVETTESFINGEKITEQDAQKMLSATDSSTDSSSHRSNSSHSTGFGGM